LKYKSRSEETDNVSDGIRKCHIGEEFGFDYFVEKGGHV
jgi:hypothetical protein